MWLGKVIQVFLERCYFEKFIRNSSKTKLNIYSWVCVCLHLGQYYIYIYIRWTSCMFFWLDSSAHIWLVWRSEHFMHFMKCHPFIYSYTFPLSTKEQNHDLSSTLAKISPLPSHDNCPKMLLYDRRMSFFGPEYPIKSVSNIFRCSEKGRKFFPWSKNAAPPPFRPFKQNQKMTISSFLLSVPLCFFALFWENF